MSDAEASAGGSKSERPGKKRKLHTFEKARLAFDKIRNEKEKRKQDKQFHEQERQEALAKSRQLKREKTKLLGRRTKRGQPKLNQQVEFLLKKIEKNIAKDQQSIENPNKSTTKNRSGSNRKMDEKRREKSKR